ncbi:MAG TPA: transglycosylase SLT domain-containing protein, partial [Patescibacteria group bacterium]|nr:transglycosylase SLT domain-containing protein [Patescibacteria group bacterium]
MRNRTRIIAAAAVVASFFGGFAARAAECGPGILEMADGMYYHLPSGLQDPSCTRLKMKIASPQESATAPAETPAVPVPPSGELALQPSLTSAILRARQMLQAAIDADVAAKKKQPIVSSYDVWVDVTLAVWDSRTDEIALVHAGKSGTKLDVDPNADVGVSVRFNNGVNSQFAVDDGDKMVVAVRYPIFKDVTVKRRHPRYQLQDVVYTPYSDALRTPEVVALGRETLRRNIAEATEALRASGVRSRAFPDRLLVDVIDPKLLEAIAVIEHLGEASLLGPNAQAASESFYVIVAANQDDAYAYSRSSAGARGLVQFIPSTYALMTKRSDLGLIKDFEAGMSDPVNAIKAQMAYLDAELASMPASVKDLYAIDPSLVDEYLAAAYNGGGARVRKAIKAFGDAWALDPTERKASLQAQYDTLFSQAETLRKKILAEDDPAVWRPMQKRLNALRADRAQVTAKLNA